MLWFSTLLLPFLGIGAYPFVREALRPDVATAREKTKRAGQIAALPSGKTWYSWHGLQDGPVAVCVHGLSTPAFVWGAVVDILVAQGFRVLTYDLYGRGLSDRAPGEQSADFHLNQLNELLKDQQVADGFTLLGYSMGGAIATHFAARHPERLKQAVLIAPAGLGHDLGPTTEFVLRHNLPGDWLMLTRGARELRDGIRLEAAGFTPAVSGIYEMQEAELTLRGYIPAITSSLRHFLRSDLGAEHEKIAASKLPLTVIWAAEDTVIPIANMEKLAVLNPDAQQISIAQAPHGVTYTHPDEMRAALRHISI